MREPFGQLFPVLCAKVRLDLSRHPECHGLEHTLRVLHNAREILREEHGDQAVVEYAAMLHDIGRVAEFADEGKSCHATVGAEMAPAILREIGVQDSSFIDHVAACVQTHRFRARNGGPPASIEAKIVYDADKLDSMGAIGIGRAFHFAGRIGARVHNSRQEALAGDSYSLEDSAYREFLVKLRYIQDRLLTQAGRRMGQARHETMAAFFETLKQETGVG